MMKRSHWLECGVGIFVIIGFLGLVWLGLQVSGLTPSASEGSYTVYAEFGDIGGLKPNARVTMSGVTVGKVESITLDPKWLDAKVTMQISDTLKNKLSDDSTAAVQTSGLLGEQYVGLTTGASTQMLQNGGTIRDTQDALSLNSLIQQFMSNMGSNKGASGGSN